MLEEERQNGYGEGEEFQGLLLVWTSLVGMRRAPTIVAPRRCERSNLKVLQSAQIGERVVTAVTVQLSLTDNQPRFQYNSVTACALLGTAGGWTERKNALTTGFSSTLDTPTIISHCTKKVPVYIARNSLATKSITRRITVYSTHLCPVKENDDIVEWMGRYL